MKQSINFLSSLAVKKALLTVENMLALIGILLGLLVLISAYLGLSQWRMARTLDNSQHQLSEVQTHYNALVKKHPLLASDKPLMAQLTAYEEQLRLQRESFQQLTHSTFRQGFSMFMYALATETPDAMWLTNIDINQDSGSIRIKGHTLSADSISELIAALSRNRVFSQAVFNLFYVKKIPNKVYLAFAIANDNLDEEMDALKTGETVPLESPKPS